MPQYKVTFLFNQNRLGWSETWYYSAINLQAVKDATNDLAKKRAAMLGQGSVLEAWRISDIAKPRQCSLNPAPLFSQPELLTDTAWNGILVEVCAGDAEYRRSVILRGVPDDWIKWDGIEGRMTIATTFKSKHNAWCSSLVSGWQLRVISKDPVDENPRDLNAPAPSADGDSNFEIPGTTAVVGQTMRLDGFTGPDKKLMNGVHKVLKVVGNLVTLDIPFDSITEPWKAIGGKAHHQKIVYRNITECKPLRAAKKSTGRAFFVPRGRR